MTKQDQYFELCSTVKCAPGSSLIHGVGIFALRDIPKGERLYVRWTKDLPMLWYTLTLSDLQKYFNNSGYEYIRDIILGRWPCLVNGREFRSPNYDVNMICFVNHSENGNYNDKTDTAVRDIAKGEEITENYKTMKDWERAFPWLAESNT